MSSFSELDDVVLAAALRGKGAFWFDGIGSLLAKARWVRLQAEYGINKSNYGTARVLEANPLAGRNIIGYLDGPMEKVAVEYLQPDVAQRYRSLGLEFYLPDELKSTFPTAFSRAFELISAVRGAAGAVSSVLSVLHVLKPDSVEYDVSYSDPSVPFSIFVGIACADQLNGEPRLAEGILHECMHLQLTLIEERMPLIAAENESYLSPWRQTFRPTRGLLHALYVFRVIQDFFAALAVSTSLSDQELKHILHRLKEIDEEVEEVADLSASQDLTPAGRALVARLKLGNRTKVFAKPSHET